MSALRCSRFVRIREKVGMFQPFVFERARVPMVLYKMEAGRLYI